MRKYVLLCCVFISQGCGKFPEFSNFAQLLADLHHESFQEVFSNREQLCSQEQEEYNNYLTLIGRKARKSELCVHIKGIKGKLSLTEADLPYLALCDRAEEPEENHLFYLFQTSLKASSKEVWAPYCERKYSGISRSFFQVNRALAQLGTSILTLAENDRRNRDELKKLHEQLPTLAREIVDVTELDELDLEKFQNTI